MINSKNYYERIKDIDVTKLPDKFKDGHDVVNLVTGNGKTWKHYQESEEYKGVIDSYFKQLDEYLSSGDKAPETKENIVSKTKSEAKPTSRVAKTKKQKTSTAQAKEEKVEMVERIGEDLRFLKRFVNLHGKVKTKEQILSFLSSLQKAILEKRIRKTSAYAKEIEYVQESLIEIYYQMKGQAEIELNVKRLEAFKEILGSQRLLSSIPFIKRYINMNGKPAMKRKAILLLKQVENAIEKGKITHSDPYYEKLKYMLAALHSFTKHPNMKVLNITKSELNGLEGALGCSCQSLNGIDDLSQDEQDIEIEQDENDTQDEPRIMNSMDFANVKFVTIGLKGKWYDLIGDPTPGFTAMVFGKPKMGKSFLCVEFAGYLARHHGKVLYVAKEEGLDATLQLKTKDKDVAHPNLTISDGLPKDLSPYDYIFLDSVTKMRLSPRDLEQLEKENPGKSFIYIFQTTKLGNFRGANAFQHEADIIIEVPDKGIAVQNGRFNQGGQMGIFKTDPREKLAA